MVFTMLDAMYYNRCTSCNNILYSTIAQPTNCKQFDMVVDISGTPRRGH